MVKEEKDGVNHRRKLNFCWSKPWFPDDMLWYSHCGREMRPGDTSEVLVQVIIFKPHFPITFPRRVLVLRLRKASLKFTSTCGNQMV